jgi:hypothetical protein
MAMVREQDVLFVAGPAIDFARRSFARPVAPQPAGGVRRPIVAAAAGLAAFLAAYAPQLLAYDALNGHPSPTVTVSRKMSWTAPHALDVLFSPQHGLFFWTPLALAGFVGLVWLALGRRDSTDARWVGALGLVMGALQVWVAGSIESWTVAGSFGQRRFLALTPLLALGLAALWPSAAHSRRRRVSWTAGVALCIWWNIGLMAQFGLHTMDRQRLAVAANARATFLELPAALPSIVWRYFTDRSSLYGLPRR